MTVRLRSHHLLCVLTYIGKGYSPAFTANYDVIAGRLSQGEDILIAEGPDDICAPLLNEAEPHCLRPSVTERDSRAAADLAALLGRPIRAGERLALNPEALRVIRVAFAASAIRGACLGCEWSDLCSGIASGGYPGIRLHAPADVT